MIWGIVGFALGLLVAGALYKFQMEPTIVTAGPQVDLLPSLPEGHRRHVLEGVGGDLKDKTFVIGLAILTIGRSQSNIIQTLDSKASRTHCQLRGTAEGVKLFDLNSSNGTLVNGEPVDRALLRDGDEIAIGAAKMRFRKSAKVDDSSAKQPKEISRKVGAATSLSKSGQLKIIIDGALSAADGDVAVAARKLGCDMETLLLLLASELD